MKLPKFLKRRIDTRKNKRLTLEEKRKLIKVIKAIRPKEETKEPAQQPSSQEEKQTETEAIQMETKTNTRKAEEEAPQQKKNTPIIETSISKSKDGKYIIHRTTITDIKPVGYYEKVMEGSE